MKTKLTMIRQISDVFLCSEDLALAEDRYANSEYLKSSVQAFTRDAAITMKVKTRLVSEHITRLGHIHVDTNNNGDVWLSGNVRSREAAIHAVATARGTEGVQSVYSDIKIKQDD